jgi:hypothetical protein
VKYYVLHDENGAPRMLVRLDWPKVQQFITPERSLWTDRPSLAKLEWDSSGDICSDERAAQLARAWGAEL